MLWHGVPRQHGGPSPLGLRPMTMVPRAAGLALLRGATHTRAGRVRSVADPAMNDPADDQPGDRPVDD